MKDFLRNSVLFGIGIFSKAQKDLEKTVNSLIKKNKISKKEGKEMLDKFLKESKKTEAKLHAHIKKETVRFAKKVSLAKQKDLLALEKRVKKLEAKKSKKPVKKKVAKKKVVKRKSVKK